jgi:hypothetical protein
LSENVEVSSAIIEEVTAGFGRGWVREYHIGSSSYIGAAVPCEAGGIALIGVSSGLRDQDDLSGRDAFMWILKTDAEGKIRGKVLD